jgi:hypothetical protein
MKDTCIEFVFPPVDDDDGGVLLLFANQVATLGPEFFEALDISRAQLRKLFESAAKMTAVETACPMRVMAIVRDGGWRLELMPDPDPSLIERVRDRPRQQGR